MHEQKPDEPPGCGRFWLAKVTLLSDGTWRIEVDTNYALRLPIAQAIEAAQASDSKCAQGAAEKWLGAVTALYALFSLTSIATAKDALIGVSNAWKVAIAVALVAGVLTAAGAVIGGYTAAYGWPRVVDISDAKKQEEWYKERQVYGQKVVRHLQSTITLTLISLTCIVVMAMLVWFAPRAVNASSANPIVSTGTQ